MLKVTFVASFLYFVSEEVGKKESILIKELGPLTTGTQVLRTALNASLVWHSVCFTCGTQATKKRSEISNAIDLKPTIVSFLYTSVLSFIGSSLKFLRLKSD